MKDEQAEVPQRVLLLACVLLRCGRRAVCGGALLCGGNGGESGGLTLLSELVGGGL